MVVQVFDYMKENDKVSPPTYTSYFSLLGKSGQSKKAILEFNELPLDSDVRLNVYVCNSILSTMIYNGKIDKAFRLFERLKSEGLKPDTVTYSTVSLLSAPWDASFLRVSDLHLANEGIQPPC